MTSNLKVEAKSGEIHAISYLRGLAALGVVLHHVRMDLWVGLDWIRANRASVGFFDYVTAWLSLPTIAMGSCVMLFFVISGFCIHLPYAGSLGRPFEFKKYLLRRFLRIYPVYFIAILFALFVQSVGWANNLLPWPDWRDFTLSIAMGQNIFGNQILTNAALWTIPIEVEFYLAFPLIYFGLRRLPRVTLWIAILISAGAAIFCSERLFLSLFPFMAAWVGGAVLAEAYKNQNLNCPPLKMSVLGGLSLVLAVTGTFIVKGGHLQSPQWMAMEYFAYGVFFLIVVWWVLAVPRMFLRVPPFLHRALMALGLMSYSLYLFHPPLFRLLGWYYVEVFSGKPKGYLITYGFAGVAIAFAWIIYKLIEEPFHKLAKTAGVTKCSSKVSAVSGQAVG